MKYVLALFAAALLTAAVPTRVADPMTFMHFLIGRWNCTTTLGGNTTTYTAEYTAVLGGQWMRTINSSKGYSSEDMMTYSDRHWLVVDMEPYRTASVLSAEDTGAAHIAFKPVYPQQGLNVTFDRKSFTDYTMTFSGTLKGKPANWVDNCTRRRNS